MTFRSDAVVVAIIHYNTPELTKSCIGSLIYNGGLGEKLRLVVFDNSDALPFGMAGGVEVIDNTHGQVIDFDAELEKFPDRDRSIGCAKGCEFGSVKHMMTVQKLWELLPQGFILMESDIMITRPITEFVRRDYSFVGYAQKAQPGNPFHIGRVLPMLCWMNVPLLKKYGARYYDPARTYGLLPGGRENRNNWYDTGAVMLEDILKCRPHLKGLHLDIRPYVIHYGSASWKGNDQQAHQVWINSLQHIMPSEEKRDKAIRQWEEGRQGDMPKHPTDVALCAIGRLENRYAVEWVEHYKRLGFSKIFIYDNNHPEDGEIFADVLQPYVDEGLVEIMSWNGLQKECYEDCYNRHNGEYEWIGFFDFDEFLEIDPTDEMPEPNVRQFLADCGNADVVVVNWLEMTDSGLTHYDPRPVRERFTEAAPANIGQNHHVKSFVHFGIEGISFNDPHCPNHPRLTVINVYGEEVEQRPLQPEVIHEVARIVHYETKSTEEFISIKVARGTCCGEAYSQMKRERSVDEYFSINERTREKEEILGCATPVTEAHKQSATQDESASKPKSKKRANRKGKKI